MRSFSENSDDRATSAGADAVFTLVPIGQGGDLTEQERSRKPGRLAEFTSRDEMNLAEFPLTVLSTRANASLKTLEFSDTVIGRNGERVTRQWIITGADKFGLPTASDDEILLGLLTLSVIGGFSSRKVHFSRYELLRILRWTTEGRSYSRLQKGLDRLSGVRIKATNAFFDNDSKAHNTKNFGIIDEYEINDGRDPIGKPSFFTWSEVLYDSFRSGFIKKLDLDFYLDLQSAVSKRLFRYLDKHFWYRSVIHINLFTLAHEKVGISRNYRYVSSLRQQLDPALDELVSRGFLNGYRYQGRGDATEVTIIAAEKSGNRKVQHGVGAAERGRNQIPGGDTRSSDAGSGDIRPVEVVVEPRVSAKQSGVRALEERGDLGAGPIFSEVNDALVKRGLKPNQVARLVAGKDEACLRRIQSIVRYFDSLCASNSKLVSRSPIGFLYRAVERPYEFVLPGEAASKSRQTEMALAPSRAANSQQVRSVQRSAESSEVLQSQYLIERKREISQLKGDVDLQMLTNIRREVEGALVKMRAHISEQGYEIAVEHGIDEKLAKLFGLPDFGEWMAERGKRRRSE